MSHILKRIAGYETSLKAAKKDGDESAIQEICNTIGRLYKEHGDYDQALKYHYIEQEICERLDSPSALAISYRCVGDVLLEKNDFSGAIDSYSKQLAVAKDDRSDLYDQRDISSSKRSFELFKEQQRALAGLGDAYRCYGDEDQQHEDYYAAHCKLDQASHYLEASIAVVEKLPAGEEERHEMKQNALVNLGHLRSAEKRRKEAIRHYQDAINIAEWRRDDRMQARALCYAATEQSLLGDYAEALETISQAEQVYKSMEDREGQRVAIVLRGEVLEAQGDYYAAIDAYERIRHFDATWYREQSRSRIDRCVSRAAELRTLVRAQQDAHNSATDLFKVGQKLADLQQHRRAAVVAQAALELNDRLQAEGTGGVLRHSIVSLLVRCLDDSDQPRKALELAENEFHGYVERGDWTALLTLGVLREQMRKPNDALEAYKLSLAKIEVGSVEERRTVLCRILSLLRALEWSQQADAYEQELDGLPEQETADVINVESPDELSPTKDNSLRATGSPQSHGEGEATPKPSRRRRVIRSHAGGRRLRVEAENSDDPDGDTSIVMSETSSPWANHANSECARPSSAHASEELSTLRKRILLSPHGDAPSGAATTTSATVSGTGGEATIACAALDTATSRGHTTALSRALSRPPTVTFHVTLLQETVSVSCAVDDPQRDVAWLERKVQQTYKLQYLRSPVITILRIAHTGRELRDRAQSLLSVFQTLEGQVELLATVEACSALCTQERYEAICMRKQREPDAFIVGKLQRLSSGSASGISVFGRGVDDGEVDSILLSLHGEKSYRDVRRRPRSLNFAANPRVGDATVATLVELGTHADGVLTSLSELDLSATGTTVDGVNTLVTALVERSIFPNLRCLSLGFNCLGSDPHRVAVMVRRLLSCGRYFHVIDLRSNFLPPTFAVELARELSTFTSRTTTLSLAFNVPPHRLGDAPTPAGMPSIFQTRGRGSEALVDSDDAERAILALLQASEDAIGTLDLRGSVCDDQRAQKLRAHGGARVLV